jgi:hypothetical protein
MSTIQIKAMEKEVEMLLAQYKIAHSDYIRYVQRSDKINATKNLNLMNELNSLTLIFLSKIDTEIENMKHSPFTKSLIKPKDFSNILIKLRKNEHELKEMSNTISDLDGKNEITHTQVISNYYHSFFYLILVIILGINIFKVATTTESGPSEIIIFFSGFIILLYHGWSYIIKILDTIMIYIEKIWNRLKIIVN